MEPMTQTLTVGTENAHLLPIGIVLFFSNAVDAALGKFLPDWRSYLPLGLGDHPTGILSHTVRTMQEYPKLTSYADFRQSSSWDSWWEPLVKYCSSPSTELGDLLSPASLVVLVLLVIAFRLLKAVLLPFFSSLGRTAGRRTHGRKWELDNEERIVKFAEYVFRFLFHSFISMVGIYCFFDKEWWDPQRGGTKNLWANYPNDVIDVGMIWYYLVQSAYNIEALLSLAELSFSVQFRSPLTEKENKWQSPVKVGWAKTVRGDFQEMMVHHVITNLLVLGSSNFRCHRVGSMVFMVHDVSDVPVDLSKLANFLKWKKTTVGCFISMVLVWLVTRLGIFPFVIYKSVLFESGLSLNSGVLSVEFYYCYRHIFIILMGLIIILHVSWFVMFLKMGYVLVNKGETHDLSEHKGGEHHGVIQTNNNGNGVAATGNGNGHATNGNHSNGKKKK
jgi:hypothetical protein